MHHLAILWPNLVTATMKGVHIMLNRKLMATALVATLAVSVSSQASAADFRFGFHHANPVAAVAGAVIGAAIITNALAPRPVYYGPPPVAYAPAPYYAPAPAYYPAPAAYYAPAPVYYGGPAVYIGGPSRYYAVRRR
jgi:hypothetical protein